MGIVNSKMLKCFEEQISQSRRLLTAKPKLENVGELRYSPQDLAQDVVIFSQGTRGAKRDDGSLINSIQVLIGNGKSQTEISRELCIPRSSLIYLMKKAGLYAPVRPASTPNIKIDRNKLQQLVDMNKTLKEMAAELNVSVGKIRFFLQKFSIKSTKLEELSVLRKFFSAKTRQEKAEAYAVVDKYLEQIAKEKYDANSSISYEDYLQDFRLIFLEFARKRESRTLDGSRNLFDEIRKMSVDKKKKEIITTKFFDELNKRGDLDSNIKNFEELDFLDKFIGGSSLGERQQIIVSEYLKGHKDFDQLAEELGLTSSRVKEIFQKSIKKLKEQSVFNVSDKDIASEMKLKAISGNIDKASQNDKATLLKLKDSIYYYW